MAALVKYKYLGLSSVVEVDYATPQVKLDLYGGTPGTYTGLDRFGRVVNHPWINYGASPEEDVARIQHGYDRNSNRLWRQNDVARALSKKFDQQYTYDGLNRLTDAKTGLLNGSHVIPPGSDTKFQQQWSLDYVGNWSAFNQDDDGGGTFDLQQTRTANQVNEITNISATTGPTWTTPQYDPAGNTTSFPKPAAPTESFTAVYDAWNRMVRVIDNETDHVVQENVYDSRNFRVVKKTYDEGVLDETRHIYYTSSWQAIEERLGTDPDSADPAQQYVWGIRYIDDLVLRDRDTSEPPDGVLNERLFALQDPNWNVTTIIDDSGDVQERYEYQAYGKASFLDAAMDAISSSLIDSNILYCAYHEESFAIYLARNRFVDSSLGMWLQRDSMGYADGLSLYLYVAASPSNYVDPSGAEVDYWADPRPDCCLNKPELLYGQRRIHSVERFNLYVSNVSDIAYESSSEIDNYTYGADPVAGQITSSITTTVYPPDVRTRQQAAEASPNSYHESQPSASRRVTGTLTAYSDGSATSVSEINERINGIFTSHRVEGASENVACSQNKYARCCQIVTKVTDLETRRTLHHGKVTLEWPCPCYLGDDAIPKPSVGQLNRMAIPLPLEE